MTLWRAERRFPEEWLHELNNRVLEAFTKNSVTLAEEFERLRRTRRASASTCGASGLASATTDG